MEGRATPHHIKVNTSIDAKETVQYHLRNLRAEDRVQKVSRGLYELADDTDDGSDEVLEALIAALEDSDADAFGRFDADEFDFSRTSGGDEDD